MPKTTKKLKQIYRFLEKNHSWNEAFQLAEYKKALTSCLTAEQRLIALMHMVVHSQSSPPLTLLAPFWEHMHRAPWQERRPTLLELTTYIESLSPRRSASVGPWDRLFRSLESVKGWGPKTAALFVKCVVKLHRSDLSDLYFLQDPQTACAIESNDRLYLPVDKVILKIFDSINVTDLGDKLHPINDSLHAAGYGVEETLVWDDLWFWGFFTQNSSAAGRVFGWNAGRFWGQLSSPKSDIVTIQKKCQQFLGMLQE
ncbi:hypothetical protein [Paraburkholderia saeva]|uniref:Uncharacterized protein n=1 Tax=Paraburkholderia saeva TaxID=2777537 RepID=A0A9N8S1K8_9BURK|nr:hypothetical protein [Paraburkholderia saeva]CAG4919374.1 hypothetical protein LMG31841_04871 [Paraburkholderia saeva]